jgi:hypothetical protein
MLYWSSRSREWGDLGTFDGFLDRLGFGFWSSYDAPAKGAQSIWRKLEEWSGQSTVGGVPIFASHTADAIEQRELLLRLQICE